MSPDWGKAAMGVKTATVIALLMLSAGCTDGSQENLVAPTVQPTRAPTSAPAAPSPTPSPTTTPLTPQQAAKIYLAAVRPRNTALAKFDADWKASASVEILRADAARMVAAERNFLKVLDSNTWPRSIAENADNLANCIASSITWYDDTTRITNASEILPLPPCGGADANLIRLRLQLPSH
ncbi:hypothetical protein GCM10009789_45760 [Kribbella sancticallisti]|uniref:Uncharacterized protein n=1 Tax=Kribbella sancticallisti TaxID=460087 RepID=A0ABN2DUI7_9ACTN